MFYVLWLMLGAFCLCYNADSLAYDESIPVEKYILAIVITLIAAPVHVLSGLAEFIVDNLMGEYDVEEYDEEPTDDASSEGIKMIMNSIHQALAKMGVTEIETKTFDPNCHNAVMHIDDESYGENEIVEVFQKGYKKGDKVIRYAMVKVAN